MNESSSRKRWQRCARVRVRVCVGGGCVWWHWCSAVSRRGSTFCKWQRQTWWSHVDSTLPAARHLFNASAFFLVPISRPVYQTYRQQQMESSEKLLFVWDIKKKLLHFTSFHFCSTEYNLWNRQPDHCCSKKRTKNILPWYCLWETALSKTLTSSH